MLLALAVLPLAGPAVPALQQIESKEAEVREVLAQIQELDSSLEHVIDEYNNAQVELDKIVAAQKLNEKRLKIARANLGTAQGRWKPGSSSSTRTAAPTSSRSCSASSLDEILDGIDTAAGSATRTRRSSKRCASSARRSSSARPSSSRRGASRSRWSPSARPSARRSSRRWLSARSC